MSRFTEAALQAQMNAPHADTLEDTAQREAMRDCTRRLAMIRLMEESIQRLGEQLHKLTREERPTMARIKPLQEQARMVTSLIRGQIYITEMETEAEKTAHALLGAPISQPNPTPAPPEEKNKSGACTKRLKKNLHGRHKPAPPPLPKQQENKSSLVTRVEKELTTGTTLAETAKKNLLNGTSPLPAPSSETRIPLPVPGSIGVGAPIDGFDVQNGEAAFGNGKG
jgi:hypothetical protein